MNKRRCAGALIAVLVLSAGGPAFGELACPDARNDEEARTFARNHFGAAQEAYEAGRPLSALEHYQCSYEQVHHPDTLYNIGVLAEGIGRLEDARDAYQEYLDQYPDSEARGEIETRLRRVEAQIPDEPDSSSQPTQPPANPNPPMPLQPIQFQPQPQQLQSLQPEPQPQVYGGQLQPQSMEPQAPIAQPQPPIQRRRRTPGRILAIITMPLGLVTTAVGGILYGAAVSVNDTFQSDIEWAGVSRNQLENDASYGHSLEVAAWVTMGLGMAIVTTSIVLFAVFPRFRPLPGTETPESSTGSEGNEGSGETGGEPAPATESAPAPASESAPAPTSRLPRLMTIATPFVFDDGGLGFALSGRF